MSKRLNDSHMGFMETSPAPYLEIESSEGIEYPPGDLFDRPLEQISAEDVRTYVDFYVQEVAIVKEGILWRMTAPGYLDSTDWQPAESEEEAEAEAREMYCDDEEEDEEIEEEIE